MANGHGGARKGGGRPKGSLGVKRAIIVRQALAEDITPIEVMLKNMRFYWHEGEKMFRKLQDTTLNVDDPESVEEFSKLVKTVVGFRDRAQSCAVDAAPYCHPKFAQVEVQVENKNPVQNLIESGMSPKEAAELYASALNPDKADVAA